ncbi:MAG TPA: hypothetical protein VIJ43_05910 [Burkholderiales bacterium]
MKATFPNASSNPPGVLLVLNDVVEAAEEEFNRWYQQQHVPERLGVPGFETARRYRAIDGKPAYMAVYECESIDVLASKTYLERLANPTDWTKKVMPSFRNMLRSACRETWSAGAGVGGGAIVVQCKPIRGKEDAARRYVKDALAPGLMQSASLVRMALWEADAALTGGPSPEMALRGGSDKSADWVLFLESYDLAKTAPALDARASASAAAEHGLRFGSRTKYQLIYARAA